MARTTRISQTRNAESRKSEVRKMPQTTWQTQTYIPPEIIPNGVKYRWVRKSVDNAPDHGNWAKAIREGYRPVPRDRHNDIWPFIAAPGIVEDQNIIEIGGLVLCEIAEQLVEDKREYLEQEAQEQMNAIAWSTEGLNGAPTVNESSKVTYGQTKFKD